MILSSLTTATDALGAPVFARISLTALSTFDVKVSWAAADVETQRRIQASLRMAAILMWHRHSCLCRTDKSVCPTSKLVSHLDSDRRPASPGIGGRRPVALDAHVFDAAANVRAGVAEPGHRVCVTVLAAEVIRLPLVRSRGETFRANAPAIGSGLLRQEQVRGVEIHGE